MLYTVIWAMSVEELTNKVQEMLNKGWTVQGGLAVHTLGTAVFFYQAMIQGVEQ